MTRSDKDFDFVLPWVVTFTMMRHVPTFFPLIDFEVTEQYFKDGEVTTNRSTDLFEIFNPK